jgi:hypothetical protein
LKKLRDDTRYVIQAAARAQQAVEYILREKQVSEEGALGLINKG